VAEKKQSCSARAGTLPDAMTHQSESRKRTIGHGRRASTEGRQDQRRPLQSLADRAFLGNLKQASTLLIRQTADQMNNTVEAVDLALAVRGGDFVVPYRDRDLLERPTTVCRIHSYCHCSARAQPCHEVLIGRRARCHGLPRSRTHRRSSNDV